MGAGKVYFITGGNRGIGFELVKQLSEQDPSNTVIASTRDVAKSNALVQLAQANTNIKIVTLDVSDEDSISRLDHQLKEVAADGIDVFLSNAGISDDVVHNVIDTPKENWVKHYITNVVGPILVTKVVFPYLEKRVTKQIVWTSSVLGSVADKTFIPVSVSAYGQSKAALNYSLRGLSTELGPKGYTAIVIHPGAVSTDMGNSGFPALAKAHPDIFGGENVTVITPDHSAKSQIELFARLTTKDNGKFFNFDGTVIDW